jgi:hypothetical protein
MGRVIHPRDPRRCHLQGQGRCKRRVCGSCPRPRLVRTAGGIPGGSAATPRPFELISLALPALRKGESAQRDRPDPPAPHAMPGEIPGADSASHERLAGPVRGTDRGLDGRKARHLHPRTASAHFGRTGGVDGAQVAGWLLDPDSMPILAKVPSRLRDGSVRVPVFPRAFPVAAKPGISAGPAEVGGDALRHSRFRSVSV